MIIKHLIFYFDFEITLSGPVLVMLNECSKMLIHNVFCIQLAEQKRGSISF